MNSKERVAQRLKGESVDHPPNFNIYMTFAAHFVGEPLSRYYQDYRVLVDANLAVLDAFGPDLVQAISDPYREAVDFGLQVEFPQDGLPVNVIPLIQEPEDLLGLSIPDPSTGRRMSDRLDAVRLFHEQVGGDVPVMGWVEGALAEAADLRGVGTLMMDLINRPDWVLDLLEICTDVAIRFARAQIEAGADIIGLGDAVASQISPKMYQKFALPFEQRIFQTVRDMGALARLHICGDTNKIVPLMLESCADIIDLDWKVDMGRAAALSGNQVSLCGNFDPVAVMLQGTPEEVYRAVVNCLSDGGSRSFSAAGCEIPDGTPHHNLHAQHRALQDFNQLMVERNF